MVQCLLHCLCRFHNDKGMPEVSFTAQLHLSVVWRCGPLAKLCSFRQGRRTEVTQDVFVGSVQLVIHCQLLPFRHWKAL